MAAKRPPWLEVRTELSAGRSSILIVLAFLIPLAIWSAVSYVPWIWHPLVLVTEAGGTELSEGGRYGRGDFAAANTRAAVAGVEPADGRRANPIFLPAPHEVVRGFHRAFTLPPQLRGGLWFHESIKQSLGIIFWGFFWSCFFGIPIGLLCGTFSFFSRLIEPSIDFIRYMPAPAFGALMVAIFGLADAPKVAIIFIGTFFQMVLVIANTTRLLDRALVEAAQTLGASRRQLIHHVVVPGVLPRVYSDLRILLGWAWTYLIVAELIGAKSGITAFIDQQGRYFNFDLVYAAIIVIGVIGLFTDQVLQLLARALFPWQHRTPNPVAAAVWGALTYFPLKFLAYLRSPYLHGMDRRSEIDAAAS